MTSPSWYQFWSIAGALTEVSSVLIGGTRGHAMRSGTGALAVSVPVG